MKHKKINPNAKLEKSSFVLLTAGILFAAVFAGCQKKGAVNPAKTTVAAATNQQTEFVLTPFGKVPASKVHLVEQGTEIAVVDGNIKKINSTTGAILADYGSATQATNTNAVKKTLTQSLATQSSGNTLGNGYYVDSPLPSGKNIQSFSTSWVVPSAPVAGADTVQFLWNGADNANGGSAFMQPVLCWNNGYGHIWYVQNWGYANGAYFHSNASAAIASGTTVTGVMTQVSAAPGAYKYTIGFTGYPSITYTQTYPDPANEVIECWESYASSYTSFPPDQYVAMKSMNLQYVGSGSTNQPITWIQTNDGARPTPSGKNTVIKNNGTTNSIVDFYFR